MNHYFILIFFLSSSDNFQLIIIFNYNIYNIYPGALGEHGQQRGLGPAGGEAAVVHGHHLQGGHQGSGSGVDIEAAMFRTWKPSCQPSSSSSWAFSSWSWSSPTPSGELWLAEAGHVTPCSPVIGAAPCSGSWRWRGRGTCSTPTRAWPRGPPRILSLTLNK